MTSLSFPDVNVWLALLLEDHVHRNVVRQWWDSAQSHMCFVRLTQISVLRLLTTSAAMNTRPLPMAEAWLAYDRLFEDERVVFLDEPVGIEVIFRGYTRANQASPKLWADAWLLAFAECAGGAVITLDRALASRSDQAVLLQ